MDGLDRYMQDQRRAARATPGQFWPAYLGTLAGFLALAGVVVGACVVVPYLHHLMGAK